MYAEKCTPLPQEIALPMSRPPLNYYKYTFYSIIHLCSKLKTFNF